MEKRKEMGEDKKEVRRRERRMKGVRVKRIRKGEKDERKDKKIEGERSDFEVKL